MTIRTRTEDGVALVTLDRPERHNAIDLGTAAELAATWRAFRFDDTVRAAVVTGAGGRAFSTGLDRSAADVPQPPSPYSLDDPLLHIGPKANDLWKPVIAAVDGMACGGAFYLLGEADFLIASENSTFFDPHTTYGMVSAYESILMAQRMPLGEVARMALMGTAERLGAARAYEIGLVSELTAPGAATEVALRRAAVLAAQPTEPVQGTVRALWAAKEATRAQALAHAPQLIALGNLPPDRQAGLFAARTRHGGQEGGQDNGQDGERDGSQGSGPLVG
ncbi:Enoyl-CoA hydratase/carnithine racemase [Streptomyces sp. 2224.1]|uniref:enoyl-CoA hydratase/isomerase family protein n=1 Tax=Streptomyces sp. 2224.1 TaxID=1881020 RepID=UPI00089AD427|nr:enoyl-CoA hydratase/isomerase family protein [Streptomyces sp. 2224.1]SEC22077.1 Enoyl-CoA hydratase/carnithine racemase [Streptomyces sp. 2224.1]